MVPLCCDCFFRRISVLLFFIPSLQSTPLGRFRGGSATQICSPEKTRGGRRRGTSGAQARPQGPAVTSSGECRRTMMLGEKEHVMKQTCASHAFGLRLITFYDTSRPSKIVDKYHLPWDKRWLGLSGSACRLRDYNGCYTLVPSPPRRQAQSACSGGDGCHGYWGRSRGWGGSCRRRQNEKNEGNSVPQEGERLFDAEGCWYTFWGFLGVIPSLMS